MALTLNGDDGIAGVNGSASTPAIQGTDTNTGLTFGTDTVNVVTGGTTRATVDSNGDFSVNTDAIFVDASADSVGIGTNSPGAKLDVKGNASSNNTLLLTNGNTGSYANKVQGRSADGTLNAAIYLSSADNSIGFEQGTSSTLKMLLDSSGRLLINNNSPFGTSSRSSWYSLLQIRGNTLGTGGTGRISLGTSTAASTNTELGDIFFCDSNGGDRALIRAYSDTAGGSSNYPGNLTFWTNAGAANPTERFRINKDGVFYTGALYNRTSGVSANIYVDSNTTLYRATSSIKYKTDVENLQDSYADAILNARPVWYRSTCENDPPEHSYWGFIAEEIADIDPRLVQWKTEEIGYGENGEIVTEPCEPEPEGVQYDRFVPHLVNLIKRQKEAIEALETRVAQLEGGTN